MSAYETFRSLHEGLEAFVMPNAWDGASAVLLKRAGFRALGSTSLAIAFGLGRQDGRHAVSLAQAVANASLLADVSQLPVNGDLEDGFGPEPEDCVRTVRAAIEGRLAGLGIEDSTADPARPLHAFDAAVARIRAAAAAAKGRIVLTGRSDNFLLGNPDLEDTIRRLSAFAEAGADVLYAPALPDMAAVRAVARAVAPKPVNLLLTAHFANATLGQLAAAGVRRISTGGALYRCAMAGLASAAEALQNGDLTATARAIPGDAISKLLD
jgi:2-methylisocitrate lyase-like PEP mutase family enzyme